jgi:hypothetical protein
MLKKMIISGLLGGLILIFWSFLINGIFGFRHRIDMKVVPNESKVYEMLKQNIAEPGRYLCNPSLTPSGTFPGNEPVFSILYGGIGHEAAGKGLILEFLIAFIAFVTAAWLLSMASVNIFSSYPRKVLFIAVIGLLIAVFSDLSKAGIGGYPFRDAAILALHDVILWTVVGMVISWLFKPATKNQQRE